MNSTLRLFKALPVKDGLEITSIDREPFADVLTKAFKHGFTFDNKILSNYWGADSHLSDQLDKVRLLYGRSSQELNSAFHKSFNKVKTAPMQQLVIEQAIHYLTTYGFEAMGIEDPSAVYIPAEKLDAPAITEDLRIVVIRGLTKAELKVELMKLLTSDIALAKQTVEDVIEVAQFVKLSSTKEVEAITNKEVKVALYDHFGIAPESPIEFLRSVVYRATESTLLIKSDKLIAQLKSKPNSNLVRYFQAYQDNHGLERLAQIFYRYKPIFLALRTNANLKQIINKIRRLAVSEHKPMQEDLLNTITARLKTNSPPTPAAFRKALTEANIFRKIRLAQALKFRTTEADSILYRIRNGKSFATDFSFDNKAGAAKLYEIVLEQVARDIAPQVKGKTILIPKGIKYGLPTTEKQFTGNLPSGTFAEVEQDMIFGVHWFDNETERVDLDLSLVGIDGKIGWDSDWSCEDARHLLQR